MGSNGDNPSDIVLLKSEIEAAAARVAERAMNQTVDGMGSFVGDVFGGLIGDRVKQWRTRNLVNSLAKTKAHLEKLGIPIEKANSLPTGQLFEIFEGMSKQDDPQLSDMWAGLLGNAMSHKSSKLDPYLPRLLAQMSGVDAIILEFYSRTEPLHPRLQDFKDSRELYKEKRSHYQNVLKDEAAIILRTFEAEAVSLSLANLLRIGILFRDESFSGDDSLIELYQYLEGIKVEYSGLKDELGYIYESIRRISNDDTAPALISELQGDEYYLPYSMTKVAVRLIDACKISA